jgi:hypothetical protein
METHRVPAATCNRHNVRSHRNRFRINWRIGSRSAELVVLVAPESEEVAIKD